MARETRRQRRDARRAAGNEPAAPQRSRSRVQGTAVPAADGPVESTAAAPHARRRRGTFVRESYAELRKVEWPNRSQVIQGTVVVIIACAIVGAYLWGVDQVLRRLVQDIFI
jgi:preprotein translocase SecE subunit